MFSGRSPALRKEELPTTQAPSLELVARPYSKLYEHLSPGNYPRGAQLCLEGYAADGVFVIAGGRVKESITSPRGKTVIIRLAKPGDIIGLEAVIGDTVYGTTAETIENSKTYFVSKRDLLGALRCDPEFRLIVARQLSAGCRSAYKGIRMLALVPSVAARIAHFLLDWAQEASALQDRPYILINLTHEEIGQIIGSTRETVSRIVSAFQKKGWIRVKGTLWFLENRDALSLLASQP